MTWHELRPWPADGFAVFSLLTIVVFLSILYVKTLHVFVTRGIRPLVIGVGKRGSAFWLEVVFITVQILFFGELARYAVTRDLRLLPEAAHTNLFDLPLARFFGVGLIAAGFLLLVRAYFDLRESWRIGIDTRTAGDLVESGVYAASRNPIHLFFFLYTLGVVLIYPTPVLLAFGAAVTLLTHGVTLGEERALAARFGDRYRSYCESTPRYLGLRSIGRADRAARSGGGTADRQGAGTGLRLQALARELTTVPSGRRSVREVITWWEERRIVFNLLLATIGLVSILPLAWLTPVPGDRGLTTWLTRLLVQVFVLYVCVLTSNLWYTLGWLAESAARVVIRQRLAHLGVVMLFSGLVFSCVLVIVVLRAV